jgi:hypothetical protein
MMTEILIFVLFQGLAINGFNQAMDEGMIFNVYKKWLQKRPSWIGKPLGLCIKCSASVGSLVTFWPVALYCYGWHPFEIYVWIFDAFVLISVNWIIYKKL